MRIKSASNALPELEWELISRDPVDGGDLRYALIPCYGVRKSVMLFLLGEPPQGVCIYIHMFTCMWNPGGKITTK